ncbi:MAG: DUF58 domain-containing protein [Gammaproteobacteria bacterium]|nr:DUF58 domain-containing protein [Gammaproteobacteria bacterium]
MTTRALLFVILIAVLAISGLWSHNPLWQNAWRAGALLLLLGLLFEQLRVRKVGVDAALQVDGRLYLGQAHAARFRLTNRSRRAQRLAYAPTAPPGCARLGPPRLLELAAGGTIDDTWLLMPQRLGQHVIPPQPARLLGPLGLAWWSRVLRVEGRLRVGPDCLRQGQLRAAGMHSGLRARRIQGSGAELSGLRLYRRGDPPGRIDWKVSARCRELVTREYSEDQHLDIVVALDAGRLSRLRAGSLDRLGLFANIAARFAQYAVLQDDRIGFLLFADRVLAFGAPHRGIAAVTALRRALENLAPELADSDPLVAALRLRYSLVHRSLIVMLTDLNDAAVHERLVRSAQLLAPRHVLLVAGAKDPQIDSLIDAAPRGWRDPWLALAAADHAARTASQIERLRHAGVPVVVAAESILEAQVLRTYERLRQRRRV